MEYFAEPIDQSVSAVCPACGSRDCQLQPVARKAGVVIGGVLGGIIASALSGATVGAAGGAALVSVVSKRLPVTVTGAIGGAIVGFAWGAVAGHAVGGEIDKNVLRIYQCRGCGLEF